MRLVLFLGLAALAGCETVPMEQRAAQASHAKLCEAYFFGPPAVSQVSANEAARRGIDCRDYQAQATMLYQQRMQGQAAGLQQLQRALQPQPAMTCQTIPWGLGTRTVCN